MTSYNAWFYPLKLVVVEKVGSFRTRKTSVIWRCTVGFCYKTPGLQSRYRVCVVAAGERLCTAQRFILQLIQHVDY